MSAVKGRELDNVGEISKQKGFIGLGSKLIKYNSKYDGIIKSLLGRVVVVDNVDNAIAMSRHFGYKFRVVTLEGEILNAGGSMSGGSVNKQSGFLSRATEIKTLTSELNDLSVKIKEVGDKKQQIENRITYYEKGDRRKRAHRLITRGAAIESVAPLTKVLTETEFYAFVEKALVVPEVKGLLMEAVNEHNRAEQKERC